LSCRFALGAAFSTPEVSQTKVGTKMLKACDPENAYLFECQSDPELLAVTRSKLGSNLPRPYCAGEWKLRIAFRLGIHHPVPGADGT
jgi:hypothetical protein